MILCASAASETSSATLAVYFGTIQIPLSRSNFDQTAPRTSLLRVAVRIRNSKASRVAGKLRGARLRSIPMKSGTFSTRQRRVVIANLPQHFTY